MIHYIDTDEAAAENLLVDLARHVPPSVQLGRPRVIMTDVVFVSDGETPSMFGLDRATDTAWRLAELSTGLLELTDFHSGTETGRRIIRGETPASG